MYAPKQVALIGPTASGKSALAVELALAHNAHIFSIDSLSVYRSIDIASAKPTQEERQGVVHHGIDALDVGDYFSAYVVAQLYGEAYRAAQNESKNLIIVGGSSFYLKALLEGLSPLPAFTLATQERVAQSLLDLPSAYATLSQLDPKSASAIDPNDRYRIEKLLLIAFETGMAPSDYFALYPPKPLIEHLPIAALEWSRESLRERIRVRTHAMIAQGLIDEVAQLEYRYGRAPIAMHAIGIIETLEYLDGKLDKAALHEAIFTHTAQLAKRQSTFNRTQFGQILHASIDDVFAYISPLLM